MWAAYRCFADEAVLRPGPLTLPEAEGRHLTAVRRARPGDAVDVLNGRGMSARAEILHVEKRGVTLQLAEPVRHPPPGPEIILLIGGLKQSAWEELLTHAVELGVNRIVRVRTEHAVSEVREGKAEAKASRWREKMIQAAKQCANPWLPELELADAVPAAYHTVGPDAVHSVAALSEATVPPLSLPPEIRARPQALWVGPEGDFSQSELSFLQEHGVQSITLGPRILRAETAALSWIAALRLSRLEKI